MSGVIVGANGQLGQELSRLFPEATKVDFKELDITDAKAVTAHNWEGVDVILNAAAYTRVDEAESPEGMPMAWSANVLGVANLANVARVHNLTLVHVSTDYVFDGTKPGEYEETDPVNPRGVYGSSKAAGDLAAATAAQHYIVRTSWVIGKGPNFVRTMLGLGRERESVNVVDDQRGRPTFAGDLAAAIKHLVETKPEFGIYNFSNAGPVVSWYEFTQKIFGLANISCKVEPTTTAKFSEGKESFAPRPANSALDLAKIKATGLNITNWESALVNYLKEEA